MQRNLTENLECANESGILPREEFIVLIHADVKAVFDELDRLVLKAKERKAGAENLLQLEIKLTICSEIEYLLNRDVQHECVGGLWEEQNPMEIDWLEKLKVVRTGTHHNPKGWIEDQNENCKQQTSGYHTADL